MRNITKLLAGGSAIAAITALAAPAMASPAAHPDALTVKGPHSLSAVWGVEGPASFLSATGGTAPYTWSISPSLPTGAYSAQSGTGSDDYTVGGTWEPGSGPASSTTNYTIKVTDSAAGSASVTFKVTLAATPPATSTVSVGADTDQFLLDQLGVDYNGTKPASSLYNFDALDPVTGAAGGSITAKTGCTSIPRPNGSNAGISALTGENGTTGGNPCIDFARSSRGRGSSDSLSVSFLALAGDGVTYATTKHTGTGKSNAPTNLTTAQLTGIYDCSITNWNQIPGDTNNATIQPYLPPAGSGVRTFFLSAINVSVPGGCVNSTPEQNEGVNSLLNSPNALFPFSVGDWLTQAYHDAKCLNSGCTAVSGVICIPSRSQNLYGCDVNGPLVLNEINGTAPTTPFPPSSKATLNFGFSPTFLRILNDVVVAPEGTQPSGALETLFGPAGYVCTNATAQKALAAYGFAALPQGTAVGDCGSAS